MIHHIIPQIWYIIGEEFQSTILTWVSVKNLKNINKYNNKNVDNYLSWFRQLKKEMLYPSLWTWLRSFGNKFRVLKKEIVNTPFITFESLN